MRNVLWLLLLMLTVYALVRLLQSRVNMPTKVVWVLLIVLLPPLGAILYFLIGPKA